jgi:hypothetical protein
MRYRPTDDPLAVAVASAIHTGDVDGLKKLLTDNPDLATVQLGSPAGKNPCQLARSLLHVATDWPGHYPNGPEIVATLIAAGADPNARFEGGHTETPLHWAASSDDVAVLDALLDLGADIEAPGAVIGGGTPIADAAAFGQWKAARRLIERGATTALWQASALGLMDRVKEHFLGKEQGDLKSDEVTHAFWCACHGGQKEAAEFLLNLGANINWIGYDNLTPLGAAERAGANELVAWIHHRGGRSTDEVRCQ